MRLNKIVSIFLCVLVVLLGSQWLVAGTCDGRKSCQPRNVGVLDLDHLYEVLDRPLGQNFVLHNPAEAFEEDTLYSVAVRLPQEIEPGSMGFSLRALRLHEEMPVFIGRSMNPVPDSKLVYGRVYADLPAHAELLGLAEGYKTVGELIDLVTPGPPGVSPALQYFETQEAIHLDGHDLYMHSSAVQGTGRYVFGNFIISNKHLHFNPLFSTAGAGEVNYKLVRANYFRKYQLGIANVLTRVPFGNPTLNRGFGDAPLKYAPMRYLPLLYVKIVKAVSLPVIVEYDLESVAGYTWNRVKHGPIEKAYDNEELMSIIRVIWPILFHDARRRNINRMLENRLQN